MKPLIYSLFEKMDIKTTDNEIAGEIASDLLEIAAIKLNLEKPYSWSSGWKSPVYCDNRLSLSYPRIRDKIKSHLAVSIRKLFPSVEIIAGVATAGIPQGALVADALSLPFIYVRSKPKGHGMENMIEGYLEEGKKVVVIEDLISTGGSSLKAIEALRQNKAEVLGLMAIFNYGFAVADENFSEAGVQAYSLSNYNEMIKRALSSGYIKDNQVETLKAWRLDPAGWG